jgi:hypothetical protein
MDATKKKHDSDYKQQEKKKLERPHHAHTPQANTPAKGEKEKEVAQNCTMADTQGVQTYLHASLFLSLSMEV